MINDTTISIDAACRIALFDTLTRIARESDIEKLRGLLRGMNMPASLSEHSTDSLIFEVLHEFDTGESRIQPQLKQMVTRLMQESPSGNPGYAVAITNLYTLL